MTRSLFAVLLLIASLSGCMEPITPIQPDTKPSTGLAATLQQYQATRQDSLAKLAEECKALESQSPEAAKTNWNTKYHSIVTTYVSDSTTAMKNAFDKATTANDRGILWDELKKGFGP